MMKTCSIVFTVGWAAALVFGWLVVAAPMDEPQSMKLINGTLAVIGAGMGFWSWLRIRRGC